MATKFISVFEYVPEGIQVTPEDQTFLLGILEANKELVSNFGKGHIDAAIVMPDNTPFEECLGEDKPMLSFTEVSWDSISQEGKDEYMSEQPEGSEAPSGDSKSVRVTINDGYFPQFVEEHFQANTQEERYKLAVFLRHSLFGYAQHMVMPIMIKHKLGIDLNQFQTGTNEGEESLGVEEIGGCETTD